MNLMDVVDEVVVEVPAVHEQTALLHLARAARYFCRESRVWQKFFQIYTIEGVDTYTVDPSDTGVVLGVEWLARDGEHLQGRRSVSMAQNEDSGSPEGPPYLYHLYEGEGVQVSPVPDQQYILEGVQYLAPSRGSFQIPNWMMDAWGDAIISLACANLLEMPGKDWTNPEAAQIHMARYKTLEDRAKAVARGEDQRLRPGYSQGGDQ